MKGVGLGLVSVFEGAWEISLCIRVSVVHIDFEGVTVGSRDRNRQYRQDTGVLNLCSFGCTQLFRGTGTSALCAWTIQKSKNAASWPDICVATL